MSAARSHPAPALPSDSPNDLVSSLLGIRGFGVASFDATGRILRCNDVVAEILGASKEEVIGQRSTSFVTLLTADGSELLPERRPVLVALRTGQPCDAGTLDIRRHDGSHRWVRVETIPILEAGVVSGVLGTFTDVTASHDDAQALRGERRRLARAGDRFRRVLESVPDAIAVYSDQGFGYANAALVRLLGYESGAELVGRDVTRVLVGHAPRAQGASADPTGLREEVWRRVDGTAVVVEIAAHGIDVDGEEGTLLIARDISERKRAQMELVQSTRLASVGTLAAGVAHEINNPLTYVVANLDMIGDELRRADSGVRPERISELLSMTDDARAGAESVRKIVRGLKAFSRADEERRVTLDVTAVMDVSVNMAFNEVRHRARLVKAYGPVPKVDADEGRLGQVFINLLVNAAQAIPEGHVQANEIRIVTATDPSGRAVIEVHDSGAGIPPEVLERIFDPFFTTKPIGVGTGLGLSICHGLVAELGGELRVESAVGKGTVFRLALPAALRVEAPVSATRAEASPAVGRRGRVLVVDDDASVAEALRKVITREHDVVVVPSGKAALAQLASGESFDVILCDLMMPEMTGMSFHEELVRQTPELVDRVVFMTGGAFSAGAGAFLDRVPNARIDKPFEFRALRTLLRRYVKPKG